MLTLLGQAGSSSIADVGLVDPRGEDVSLYRLTGDGLAVIVFLGVDCPFSDRYAPRLEEIYQEYAGRGVQFVGICSNPQDTAAEVARLARDFTLTFPVVRDRTFKAADLFKAERTPEVFLLDRQKRIRYRGRIDDQIAYGVERALPSHQPLIVAIEQVLADQEVILPMTKTVGCFIGRAPEVTAPPEISWNSHVAEIFATHCASCHRTGGAGPFPLTRYEDTEGWGQTIREVVEERRMPPWHADPEIGDFAHANYLSEDEISQVTTWIDAGLPVGEPEGTSVPAPKSSAWQLGREPDKTIAIANTDVEIAATGPSILKTYVVDSGLESTKLVSGVELRPTNRRVVVYASVFVVPPGLARAYPTTRELVRTSEFYSNLLCWYSPDSPPTNYPEDIAREIPANAKLVFQILYRPTGKVERDRTSVGVTWADPETALRRVRTIPIYASQITIEPGEPIHSMSKDRSIDEDVVLLSMIPRLSSHGTSVRLGYGRGRESPSQVLLDIPRFSYFWQHEYRLREPMPLAAGGQVRCEAEFIGPDMEPTLAIDGPRLNLDVEVFNEEVIALFEVVPKLAPVVRAETSKRIDPTQNVSNAIAGLALTTLICLIMISLKPVQASPAPPVNPPPPASTEGSGS